MTVAERTELGRAGVLAWAATNGVTVRLLYRKPGADRPELRTITPSALRDGRRGERYVIADDHVRRETRTFRLSRIEGVLL